MSATPAETLTVRDLVLEVRIDASRERVWDLLTTSIHEWWPGATFCVGGKDARFTLEPHVGGRMFEDWGDGQGLEWGQVVCIKKNETLQFTGDLFPDYGGPSRAYSTYKLEDDGKGTRLRYQESRFGRISEPGHASMERGWSYLLEGCLKSCAEGREEPEWKS